MRSPAHHWLARLGTIVVLAGVFLSLVPFHELGHTLVGLSCGGTPSRLQVFGVQMWPLVAWTGIDEGLAAVDFRDLPNSACDHAMALAGSAGTLVVAAIAVTLLRRRARKGWRKGLLVALSLWSLDLLTFTLPSVGIRRGTFFGTTYSEPYEAAVGLGIPGYVFQALAFGSSALVLALATKRSLKESEPL